MVIRPVPVNANWLLHRKKKFANFLRVPKVTNSVILKLALLPIAKLGFMFPFARVLILRALVRTVAKVIPTVKP